MSKIYLVKINNKFAKILASFVKTTQVKFSKFVENKRKYATA